jgi:uncharacterized protein YecT (DUF1311 family)
MSISSRLVTLICIAFFTALAADPSPKAFTMKFDNKDDEAEYNSSVVPRLKTLENFPTVDAFIKYYSPSIQKCMNNSGGGAGSLTCDNIEYNVWKREIAIYHARLEKNLDSKGQQLLTAADSMWNKMVDKTIEFNSALLDKMYEDASGTMYIGMRADDARKILIPMYMQHALTLRDQVSLSPMAIESSASYDKKLNAAYKELAAKQDANNKSLLKAAQLQWLKARDAQITLNKYLLDAKYANTQDSASLAQRAVVEDCLNAAFIDAKCKVLDAQSEAKPVDF